jgi:hypothetical protein
MVILKTNLISSFSFKPFLLMLVTTVLQGCAYSGKFNCPDSKGATCVMLNRVDQMVDSGEIEKYYQTKSCKGLFGSCSNSGASDEHPPLANEGGIKAKVLKPKEEQEYIEGDYLYVK